MAMRRMVMGDVLLLLKRSRKKTFQTEPSRLNGIVVP